MVNRTKYFKGQCSHCGGRIEFPAEATGMTTDCPHCGKPTELLLPPPPDEPTVPRRTIIWTLITVLILAGGLVGALLALKRTENWAARKKKSSAATNAATSGSSPTSAPVPQAGNPWAEISFAASPVHLEKTPGNSLVYAVGTINNLTNRQRFGVKVELELLNASGEKVGTARDYQQVLEPNEKWQFRALVTDSKATEARVAAIKED